MLTHITVHFSNFTHVVFPLLFFFLKHPSGGSENSSEVTDSSIVAVAVSVIVLLTVLVVIIIKCTDCYNSEVSSENHPACADKQYRWGGADGYTGVNPSAPNAGFTTGERVELTQQHLPYTMIPTGVPASGGFQGYSLAGQGGDGQPSGGLAYQGSTRSNASYGGSMHYNPVEPQEPPPTYSEAAARGGSFHGHR